MDPRYNARRGYRDREQKRREENVSKRISQDITTEDTPMGKVRTTITKTLIEDGDPVINQSTTSYVVDPIPPIREDNVKTTETTVVEEKRSFPWGILAVLIALLLAIMFCNLTATGKTLWNGLVAPKSNQSSVAVMPATNNNVAPEVASVPKVEVAANAPAPASPVIVASAPVSPSVEGRYNGTVQQGEDLDTVLGKRITFTNRKIVVPHKAWNEVLTTEELKQVETQWVDYKLTIPEGMTGRIFAGGLRQGTNSYNNGILMSLAPGTYEFSLRNGEIVLWYPNQDQNSSNDLDRIITQIRNGNFDIHSELAFFATTADLLPKIPADLVQKNKVEIVPSIVAN